MSLAAIDEDAVRELRRLALRPVCLVCQQRRGNAPTTATTVGGLGAKLGMRQRIHVQPSDGLCGISYAAGGSHRAHRHRAGNAAVGSGTGHETNNLTFTLDVPANAYVGAYTSTWTFTLSSGP